MNMTDPVPFSEGTRAHPGTGLDLPTNGDNPGDNGISGDLVAMVTQLRTDIRELQTTHNEILTLVREIRGQAQPMLDKIAKSPVLSMLGVKL